MKNKISTIIIIFCAILLLSFYGYIAHMCVSEEYKHDKEMERREYIKFQRDSIELEILKQHEK